MADLPLGNVPTSTLNDTSNIIFADGENVRKESYSNVKNDMLGSANLATKEPKTKESINEIVQDILDTGGYGIISGGVVSAQTVPNMTVQVTTCPLRAQTGARQSAAANTSLAITTADTTNPRKDIVYVNSTGVISYLQGTAAASPIVPSTPTGGTLLAEIYVAANATTITNANITDKRKILISTDWLNAQLSEKANNTDNARTTTDKTVTGAINELNVNKAQILSGGKKIQSGASSATISTSGVGNQITVTFPVAFSGVPAIAIGLNSLPVGNAGYTNIHVGASTTEAIFYINSYVAQTIGFNWTAIGN